MKNAAKITCADPNGNVTHTAIVANLPPSSAGMYNYNNPVDADTVQEITTRYDARNRKIAQTVWLVPQGSINPASCRCYARPDDILDLR
jgi:hypothetical protein